MLAMVTTTEAVDVALATVGDKLVGLVHLQHAVAHGAECGAVVLGSVRGV